MKFINRLKNSQIRKEITIILVAVAVVVLSAVVFAVTYFNSSIGVSLNYFDEISNMVANKVEYRINQELNSLIEKASRLGDAGSYGVDELTKKLREEKAQSKFDELIFSDAAGFGCSSINGRFSAEQTRYYKNALTGNPNVSMTIYDNDLAGYYNAFAVPVYNDDEIIGVLIGMMPENLVKETMIIDNSDLNRYTCVINTDGAIICTPFDDRFNFEIGTNIVMEVSFPKSDTQTVLNSLKSGDLHERNIAEIDGITYYISSHSISVEDWIVITGIERSEVARNNAPAIAYVISYAAVFVFLLSFMVLFLIFSTLQIAEQVGELAVENQTLQNTDVLTGYDGYKLFLYKVEGVLKKNTEYKFAMLSVDINKFRAVNELLGHNSGDAVLKMLADVINRNIDPEKDTFTRRSADSFLIFMSYKHEIDIAEKIDAIINDADYQISLFRLVISFGVYLVDDRSLDIRLIIDRADLARRTIKENIESGYAFFDTSLLDKIREEKAIEDEMEHALDSKEFKVYLQPKYDLKTKDKVIGAEALVRWVRNGEVIPPGKFIPLFEKNGFVSKLDKYVFDEVCRQQKLWLAKGYEMRIISVNMSRANVQDDTYVDALNDICTKYNVPTKYIEIEITESVAFENVEILSNVFAKLKNYGFHVSIDDFGSGYSSLNMLKDLPADVLKIDRVFLSDSVKNKRASAVIANIINLALNLDMKTICEGIETSEQAELLSGLGCDMAQGFYFARPMPIADYEKLVYNDKEKI